MAKQPTILTIDDIFDYAKTLVDNRKEEMITTPLQWIEENFIDPITGKLIELQSHQRRILRRALQTDEHGHSRYNLVVWSEPKKSGKTTIAAAAGAYVACRVEAPNEISCVANDQEQASGRIFAAMMPTLNRLGWNVPVSKKGEKREPAAYGPNNSTVHAITTKYEKEAGSNQGISLWSELWAYKGERLTRLWEEMTPPPTRKFSMRWVESYAGFIGENILFQSIYQKVFKDFQETELQPDAVKLWPDLPVYEVDEGKTLVYWSHEPRMPWQTKSYYISQAATMRPASFKRLHKNYWVDSSDTYITDEMWRNSVREQAKFDGALTYALDGSKNDDCTALAGSGKIGDYVHTCDVHIWEPETGFEIDFAEVERVVLQLYKSGKLKPPLWYDPYQCTYLAQRLRARGVPCEEFSQGQLRVRADTFLYKLYKSGKIINTPDVLLRRHVLAAAVQQYGAEKMRIVKPEIPKDGEGGEQEAFYQKVDGAVAQSMSVYKAYHSSSGGWGASGI